MSFLLLFVIILLYSLQTLFCTLYTKNYTGKDALASPVFSVWQGLAIALITLAFLGFRFAPEPLTLLFGALNALALFGYNTSLIKAGAAGSYAFMCIVYLFGGLSVPLLFNAFVLRNPVTPLQWVAFGGMLAAFVLMNIEDVKLGGTKPVYYVFCAILFVCNGLYATFLKMQETYVGDDSQSRQMVILTFGLMAVVAFAALAAKEKRGVFRALRVNKEALPGLAGCVVVAAAAVNLLVYLLPLIDLAVLYPVEDGGVLVVSTLFSVIFFKEKLTVLKVIGIAAALAGIVALSL